jgi:Mn2+/Fe2+ NRAMP family transporter
MATLRNAVPPQPQRSHRLKQLLRSFGPGIVAGGADNDPAGILAFSYVGATTGFSQLWILLLSTPMETAVQTICGIIGADTKHGLATMLRARFGRAPALALSMTFVIGNVAALSADTLIVAASLSLLTGMPQWYFPVLVLFFCWNLITFHSFRRVIAILQLLTLGFLGYVAAAIVARPHWGSVLAHLVIPHFGAAGVSSRDFLLAAAALIGCRLSPYMFYWQASAETEKYTDVRLRDQTVLDISVGMVASNLIGFFIMVTMGATLFVHHSIFESVRDAALALRPVAGPAAYLLYALGIAGSGLIAIPVLSATSSYVVAETMNWRKGLDERPWQAQRFYVVLSGVFLVVACICYLPVDTVRLAVWSQIAWGLLAPVLLIFVFFLERRRSDRRIRVPRTARFWLLVAIVVSGAVAVLVIWMQLFS